MVEHRSQRSQTSQEPCLSPTSTVYRGKLIANHFSELQMCVDWDGSEEHRMGILLLLIYSESSVFVKKTPKKKLSLRNEETFKC